MEQLVCAAAEENVQFFLNDSTLLGKSLRSEFQQLAEHCRRIAPDLAKIREAAPRYDFDVDIGENGYRSFVVILERLLAKCLATCELVKKQRRQIIFRLFKYSHARDLKSWNDMLVALHSLLEHVILLLDHSKDGGRGWCLFGFGGDQTTSRSQLIAKCRALESASFYGRHVAFQYCPSIEHTLKVFQALLAGYSYYYGSGQASSSRAWKLVKSFAMGLYYTIDDDLRARRILLASQTASVEFCKSFWTLPELGPMKKVPDYMCPPMRVNRLIHLPPQALQLTSLDGRAVNIPVPAGSHDPVQVRLLIAKGRASQQADKLCDTLIIHCHGGGFVSQTSQAHEMVTRS